jgi:hypothetical protein
MKTPLKKLTKRWSRSIKRNRSLKRCRRFCENPQRLEAYKAFSKKEN